MRALLVVALLCASARADELADITVAVPACPDAKDCFAIQLHVVVGESGTIATAQWFADQLALANTHFAASDIAFQLAGVDALPESVSHVKTRADRNALARGKGRLGGGVIHVYLVGALDDVDVIGEARNGVAWRVPKDTRKYVILAATARPVTLAHELGHVFGLPHSDYAESIMNKTPREKPPMEERSFVDAERKKIKATRDRLVREKQLRQARKT